MYINNMKKSLKVATMIVAGTLMFVACNRGEMAGFKTTDHGLYYKFEKQDKSAQQVQDGDVIVGEMVVRFDSLETFSNVGHPDRILQAKRTFDGDLYEGLLMMHIGDKAIFAIEADTLAKYLQPNQMPPTYVQGNGMKVFYEITLHDIVTKEEIEEEQNNFMTEMQERQQNEPAEIEKYVKDNNITVKPTANGLYVVVKKKGNGAKVAAGKQVAINYTGRLLDGTVFDSSEGKEPLTYTVGQMSLIPGWEDGVKGQPEGSQLQLVIPSALAYGSRGNGRVIPPYSPLVFDLEIVSVK